MDAATREFHLNVALKDLASGESDFDGNGNVTDERLKRVLTIIANDPRPIKPTLMWDVISAYTEGLAAESVR